MSVQLAFRRYVHSQLTRYQGNAMLAEIGLRDLVTEHGYFDTRTSHYKKAGRYADYMLVSSRVNVLEFTVVDQPEVSDHRPLLLRL